MQIVAQKKSWYVYVLSGKIDILAQSSNIKIEFIMIKGLLHWKDKTFLTSIHSVTWCQKQKLTELKEEMDKSTIRVGDFKCIFH